MSRSTGRGVRRRSQRRLFARLIAVVLTVLTTPIAAATPVPISPDDGNAPAARVAKDTSSAVVPYQAPTVGSAGGTAVDGRLSIGRYQAPDSPTEVVSARGESQRVVANPNGTLTVERSAGRINYLDEAGKYQPIDLSLVPDDTAPNGGLKVAANDRDVQIALGSPDEGMAVVAMGSHRVAIRSLTPGVANRTTDASVGVDKIAYAAESGPSVFVRPTTEGIEYGATWSDAAGEPFIDFAFDPGPLEMRVAADGQTIEFVELADPTTAKVDVVVGRISPPTILEGPGGKLADAKVAVSFEPQPLESKETVVRYALDSAWLTDASRTFPVVLDPTFTICRSGCDDPNSFWLETYLGADNPNTYPTSPSVLRVGYDAIGSNRVDRMLDPGLIESRIPRVDFDRLLAPSERSYGGWFGSNLRSSEIVLRTGEQFSLFNSNIVR